MIAKLRDRYPDRVPVVLVRGRNDACAETLKLKTERLLVPRTMTVSQLKYVVERKVMLASQESLLLFTLDGTMPRGSRTLGDVYDAIDAAADAAPDAPKEPLHLVYRVENTFG